MLRIREVYVRWIGIFILGTLLGLIIKYDNDRPLWICVCISIVFTGWFWNGAFLIFMYFRRRFPLIRQTPKRLIITLSALILLLTFGGIPLKFLFGLDEPSQLRNVSFYLEYWYVNFPVAIGVGVIYEAVFFFDNWKNTIKVNEALKNQQIRTQFEVLKNQMSPHFLFNSLNTLTALIAEKNDNALEFTQRLSDVYRYILNHKEKELVKLKDEIHFVNDYLFLLQMRFPENLIFDENVSEAYQEYYIAPLTLQMLVENAIKHNVIAPHKKLTISITVENDQIKVCNNLQPKSTMERSTKTGLQNISRRYQYLGNRKVSVRQDEESFTVLVPLIKLLSETEFIAVNPVHESIDH